MDASDNFFLGALESGQEDTNELLHEYLDQQESEYCTYLNYRFFIGSWNVNGRFEERLAIDEWLQGRKGKSQTSKGDLNSDDDFPHLYILGFQELDLSLHNMARNKSTTSHQEERWLKLIENSKTFSRHPYKRLARSRLAAIFLVVYVHESCWPHVHPNSVLTSFLPTGMFNMVGNKGAAAITFQFHDAHICFITVHLAAGESNIFRRNQDFQTIMSRLLFNESTRRLEDHDFLFIFGDMNYRITLEPDVVKKHIAAMELDKIIIHDELLKMVTTENIFNGFSEGLITFIPTYKFNPNSSVYDTSEKNRIPSYCDRILWRNKRESLTQLTCYSSCNNLMISDHKPIFATFDVSVKKRDPEKYQRVYEKTVRDIDGAMNAILPRALLDTQDLYFDEVRMLEAKKSVIHITNVGRSSFTINFKAVEESSPGLPEWLTTSGSRQVKPGEKIALTFEAYINPKFVRKFYSGEYVIDNIFILTLQRGKHFFISTHGTFLPTSYGLPLTILVNMATPIARANLIQLQEKIKFESECNPVYCGLLVDGTRFCPTSSIAIPKEIFRMVEHLYKNGLCQPDLFRQPGTHAQQQLLRLSLDTGGPFDPLPSDVSIHTVVEALLTFLDSLYEPVIPARFCDLCLTNTRDAHASANTLQHLPIAHLHLFVYLMSFLRELLKNASSNGVDIKLITDIFGDLLFRDYPSRVVQNKNIHQFLSNFLQI